MVAAELKVVGGKHAGQIIPLNRRKFLIGREEDCQLRPNSDMVSRHHCVFSVDDFSVRLRDLGSTNGTLVNGERIRKDIVLSAGDRVVIGNLEFELVIKSGVIVPEADSTAIPPVTLTVEDTQVTSKTVLEIPVPSKSAATAPVGSETTTIQVRPGIEPASTPVPVVGTGDTMMMSPGQMMPGQYPYQQMMPQMGYPGGMYGGFPYPPMMPGYGQMYPQMMPQMGYPMQAPGMQPMPVAPQTAAQPAVETQLPDPETTGAKESDAVRGSSGASPKDGAKPTGAADAIIKQYMGRRPGG